MYLEINKAYKLTHKLSKLSVKMIYLGFENNSYRFKFCEFNKTHSFTEQQLKKYNIEAVL